MKLRRWKSSRRSGFETTIDKQLKEAGVEYKYEPCSILWRRNVSKGVCIKCGADSVAQQCSYTPDFVLGSGIWLEVKGYLDGPDRTKLRAIRQQYPDLDLRLVFQRPVNIIKGTKNRTTYWQWAEANGFIWYDSKSLNVWLAAGMPVGAGVRKTKHTLRSGTTKTKIGTVPTQQPTMLSRGELTLHKKEKPPDDESSGG